MSAAVSSNASDRRLSFFLGIWHLLNFVIPNGFCDLIGVSCEQLRCNLPHRQQFVRFNVLPVALGKAVEIHGSVLRPVGNHHAITAGASLSLAGDALLDEIGRAEEHTSDS